MNSGRRPNILWLMTDEQRTDSLGCYGSSWARTPHLDQLATDAVLFDNAYTPAPVCLPCRLSLIEGRYPCETGVWINEGNPMVRVDSLIEPFRRAGYATATFGKQHYGGSHTVFDVERSLVVPQAVSCYDYQPPYRREDYGGIKFGDHWILGGTFPEPMENKCEWQAVTEALEWLEKGADDRPFFLRVSLSAPHTPVVPPVPFDTLIPESEIALPADADGNMADAPRWLRHRVAWLGINQLDYADVPRLRRFYYGEVAFTDHVFGRLLEQLRGRDLLENTIIVYVSDHGTHLGDHQTVQKGTFFEASARVPYFYRLPPALRHDGGGARRINTPVSTISLLPTLLDLCGLEQPTRRDATSLAAVVRDGALMPAEPVFSQIASQMPDAERQRMIMVREGSLKLIRNVDDPDEIETLIDLAMDPCEQTNLRADPMRLADLEHLRALIDSHLEGTAPIRTLVYEVESFSFDAEKHPRCVTCGTSNLVRSAADADWAGDYIEAFVCGHCGQKFGRRGRKVEQQTQ